MGVQDLCWTALFGGFVLFTALQLAAWWGVFAPFAFSRPDGHKPLPMATEEQPGAVSVIICARNESENLRRFLPFFLDQQYEGPWELLVVDDASDDDTPQVLEYFQKNYPDRLRSIRVAEKKGFGKKQALARGISDAAYKLILLSDADCKPASAFWLQKMARALTAKPETEMVLGYAPLLGHGFARYEAAYTAAQYFALASAGMPYMGVGRNLAFKRLIFDRVGGFAAHAHLTSGDDDLLVNAAANAQNTAICCQADAFVYSRAPQRFHAWFRQKQRHLAAGPAYRWPHKIVLALLAVSLAGHYGLGLTLIGAGVYRGAVLGLMACRYASVCLVFGKTLRRFNARDLRYKILYFDALLALYYGLLVPLFLLGKRRAGW